MCLDRQIKLHLSIGAFPRSFLPDPMIDIVSNTYAGGSCWGAHSPRSMRTQLPPPAYMVL